MNSKFPYECTDKETSRTFIPTMIDYENQQVWWQRGQSSDNGGWKDFRDVEFKKNDKFVDLSDEEHF